MDIVKDIGNMLEYPMTVLKDCGASTADARFFGIGFDLLIGAGIVLTIYTVANVINTNNEE